jgi:hypothetical protein
MILVLFNSYTADKYIPNSENNFLYFANIKHEYSKRTALFINYCTNWIFLSSVI